MTAIIEVADGIEVIGVATEEGRGYRLESGHIYGSPTHPYYPGAIVVKPAAGYAFVYDVQTDWTFPSKSIDKIITITMRVTNEHEEARIRNAAPRWPGLVSISEVTP